MAFVLLNHASGMAIKTQKTAGDAGVLMDSEAIIVKKLGQAATVSSHISIVILLCINSSINQTEVLAAIRTDT
jgi:hypothetical protein